MITKKASIFGYTDDKSIRFKIIGYDIDEKEYLKSVTVASRACDLLDYADLCNDAKLKKEIESTFKAEIESFFNE